MVEGSESLQQEERRASVGIHLDIESSNQWLGVYGIAILYHSATAQITIHIFPIQISGHSLSTSFLQAENPPLISLISLRPPLLSPDFCIISNAT
jgi:hypothetical protein